MHFTVDKLNELGVLELDVGETDEDSGVTIISDKMVEHKRWSIRHALTFRLRDQPEDEAYRVSYYVPATECQECDTWQLDWDDGLVPARIVRRTMKMVEVWE